MSVTKTQRECYEVRSKHEWANITMHCWDSPPPPDARRGMYYCGEIQIHSSFGAWGYVWTACGVPFKQFLMRAEFDYVFTKFMGSALNRFDGKATLKRIRRDIIERRRRDGMSRDQAREAWDLVDDERNRIESDGTSMGYGMWDIGSILGEGHPMADYFSDPCCWPTCTRHDAQAVGFWRELWPLFIEALKDEVSQPQPAAVSIGSDEAVRLARVALDESRGAPIVCDWMSAALKVCRHVAGAAR